jgi:hypothetical protein
MMESYAAKWAETLQSFVCNFETIPPTEVYLGHPAFEEICRAIVKRRVVLKEISPAWKAAQLLRETVKDKDNISIEGFRSASEARADVSETVALHRKHPKMRGMMWRYWQREKLLIGDLVDKTPPECPVTRDAWEAIRKCYAPDIKELNKNIEWIN